MKPFKIGAAMPLSEVENHKPWLFDDERDLELQDFVSNEIYINEDWKNIAQIAKKKLKGFNGRLGVHGPFWGLDFSCFDSEVAKVISKRLCQGVEAAAETGAIQMVMHSPFDNWHEFNRFNIYNGKRALEQVFDVVARIISPALRIAENEGVELVMENIKDINPQTRRQLVESIESNSLKLSIDTGHAHIAGLASKAPPVDIFVEDAGNLLKHVHIQDGDGYADRHQAPGNGTINWHSVFQSLSFLESNPHLILELKNYGEIPLAFSYLSERGLAV